MEQRLESLTDGRVHHYSQSVSNHSVESHPIVHIHRSPTRRTNEAARMDLFYSEQLTNRLSTLCFSLQSTSITRRHTREGKLYRHPSNQPHGALWKTSVRLLFNSAGMVENANKINNLLTVVVRLTEWRLLPCKQLIIVSLFIATASAACLVKWKGYEGRQRTIIIMYKENSGETRISVPMVEAWEMCPSSLRVEWFIIFDSMENQ